MKVSAEQRVEVKLSLSEEEAKWLMGYLQNYAYPGEEPEGDAQMRRGLFGGLKAALGASSVLASEPPHIW